MYEPCQWRDRVPPHLNGVYFPPESTRSGKARNRRTLVIGFDSRCWEYVGDRQEDRQKDRQYER